MSGRFLSIFFAFAVVTTALSARADETAPVRNVQPRRSPTAGIVLTTIGGSLVISAPVLVFGGAAYASANPTSREALGGFVWAAIGSAAVGLGLLVPGIVMLATHKSSKATQEVLPTAKQPTWTETRPASIGGPHAFLVPLLQGNF